MPARGPSKKSGKQRSPAGQKTPIPKDLPEQAKPKSASSSRLPRWAIVYLLAGLALAGYANTFQASFHLDDEMNITKNYYLHLRSLSPASLVQAMVQDRNQNRPFSNLTLALNYYFNQEDTFGYHLVNLLLHFLTGLAIFFTLRRLFEQARLPQERRELAALLSAAVWTVLPVHTQAVTYIIQRHAVMASGLTMASLGAYLAARQAAPGARKLVLFLLCGLAMILAFGSKETALITPALILLVELYFFQDLDFAFLRRRWLPAAAGVLILASFLVLYLRPEIWVQILTGYQRRPFTLEQRLLTEPRVLVQYLEKIVWPLPSGLSLEHDPTVSTSLTYPWTTLPAILLWVSLLGLAGRGARRHPWLSFALLWYLANLFLESSLIPLDLMFEHRVYLASLAVIVPLVAGAVFYLPRLRWTVVAVSLITAWLLTLTVVRNRVWQTEISLWRDSIAKAPHKARAFLNLGIAYLDAGQPDRARADFQTALRIEPDYSAVYFALGKLYLKQGRLDLSLENFQKNLSLDPQSFQANFQRGNIYLYQEKYELAIRDYSRVAAFDPNSDVLFNQRGMAYDHLGRYTPALADYSRAIRLNPDYVEAYNNRGNVYDALGQTDRALADYRQALQLNPNNAATYYNRGLLYQKQGKADLAEPDFQRARELNPAMVPSQ
jgi:protein O-mannosyl-transferase